MAHYSNKGAKAGDQPIDLQLLPFSTIKQLRIIRNLND
jgi:hypothetical protein